MAFFWTVIGIVLLQRTGELLLAARNARVIRSLGGYEVGAEHYKFIVILHLLFFASLLLEVAGTVRSSDLPSWWPYPFTLFLLAQMLRYWCMHSLGKHWNTRILILPGAVPVVRGPYRFLRHPNYLVVAVEFFALPMTFSAPFTAIAFSLLNAWLLLRVRIPMEEKSVYERQK